MPSTDATLRLTIGALMRLTGERQADLAAGIGLGQTQISRKLAGSSAWSLNDVDRLSAHYGIPVPDLLAGVDRAVHCLPARRRAPLPGAAQLTISPE
ncbi:helix-turn-helix domain-containing protein [Streptomyces sp. NPDC008125]|uniref:helix-turn-helix domain-containing protein n=1 Tax=Streptomyces sp. NPDC008125 TaxID=3364811 RepID=UPI0036EE89F2